MIGETLAHYEILEKVGAGGMGEVYRARDTKLGREVAIKVLPEAFSRDKEKLARFDREAHLLASLNHPNIATIHGLEEHDGKPFLVMELVEGETLAEHLVRGPMPVDEALVLFQHIAEGLEAAHEKGIIHRDLKPSNIKITPEGKPKILDFGLAKALAGEAVVQDLSQSPTLTRNATQSGVLLGTAPYMSPEQARGKPVDKRADIWAFGCCLYETLAGRAAFLGETVSDTIARILEWEPDLTALPEATPAGARALLRRCLQKDSRRRCRDMWDVRVEIEEALAEPSTLTPAVSPAGPSKRRVGVMQAGLVGLMVVAIFSIIAGVIGWSLRPPAPKPVTRTEMLLPRSVGPARQPGVAISPDGTHFVSVSGTAGPLYLRAMDEKEAKLVSGTEGARAPFFSPDGQWIGFWNRAEHTLNKVSIRGGTSVPLCPVEDFTGASWGSTDSIVFGQGERGIWHVAADGGSPEVLIDLGEAEVLSAHRPQMLPGRDAVLFALASGVDWDDASIVVESLDTGQRNVLIEGGFDARYVPTGHIVLGRAETLLAVPFHLGRLEVIGGPVPVIENVMETLSVYSTGAGHFSFSDTGSLVFLSTDILEQARLLWVDRRGAIKPVTEKRGRYEALRISPDGKHLAVQIADGVRRDIVLYDIARDSFSSLTAEGNNNIPHWSPDGQWVAFASDRNGDWDLYRKRADFSGPAEHLLARDRRQTATGFSPDGKLLIFLDDHPMNLSDIWVLPLEGDREPWPFLQTPLYETVPELSPDGRWLAYQQRDYLGGAEVYVQAFPNPGAKWQISTEGARGAIWSPDGRELFFYQTDGQTVSVNVDTTSEFTAGTPRPLFRLPAGFGYGFGLHIAPDGERFVWAAAGDDAAVLGARQLHVVLNWFEELKRLVPTNN